MCNNLNLNSNLKFKLKFLSARAQYIMGFFLFDLLNRHFLNHNDRIHYDNEWSALIKALKMCLLTLFWFKIRIVYYVNNWIYTTNHKRIAVNYFWFVILSGIVGMVLATLIRLEFAYPGVGIFAGDSLQYLSLATAHGVIMVFFMIMPLLFGAFANFLLPTQLGVHDVAFPRLNSAAFWFLPGGLLMLCQLVCVDRRYQRMNCFNIREIQSILKRKFFTDLINTHDHHTLLDKTSMGARFKTNNVGSINSNISIFYNYGIEFTPKIRMINYAEDAKFDHSFTHLNPFALSLINYFQNFSSFSYLNNSYFYLIKTLDPAKTYIFLFKNFTFYIVKFLYSFPTSSSNFFEILVLKLSRMSEIPSFFRSVNARVLQNLSDFPNSVTLALLDTYSSILTSLIRGYLLWLKTKTFFRTFYNTENLSKLLTNFSNKFLTVIYEYFFMLNTLENYCAKFTTFNEITPYGPFKARNRIDGYISNTWFLNCLNKLYQAISLNNFPSNLQLILNWNKKTFDDFDYNSVSSTVYQQLDYSSRTVYLYILLCLIMDLPSSIYEFFIQISDITIFNKKYDEFYDFATNWYTPLFFNDSISDLSQRAVHAFVDFFKNFVTPDAILMTAKPWSLRYNFYFFNKNFNNFSDFFCFFLHIPFAILTKFTAFITYFTSSIQMFINFVFNHSAFSLFNKFYNLFVVELNLFYFTKNFNPSLKVNYFSNYFTNTNSSLITQYSNEELSDNSRYWRFSNPVFKYDYKSGDYFPKSSRELYTYLFTTFGDLTGGLKPAPWFNSDKFIEAFNTNFWNYTANVKSAPLDKNSMHHSWSASRFNSTDGFYNFFFVISQDFTYTNKKWIALNTLNQKFYRMFATTSMQQRIYSNWRQLKFTREAWRCKLLAARHQKTLFRRYAHEDGVFWSIERNAKDLLPGWAMITPFSSRTRFTAVGKTDIGLMGVLLVLNSSIISAANFLVTYRYLSTLNNRKMRDARAFFTEGVMVASWMMVTANPMLVIGIIMLLSDRHWQTSFFDYSGGGDTVLFQHMFWFFGHPEVYIIIIPTFGFVNTMLSYYLKKRVSARASLMYSMYTIAFLGFFVWGHHMYMVGLAHTTRMLFSTLTVMISVPAATKIMHWCVTMVNSAFAVELPLLFTITFIFFFVSGGISGMCVAHTGMDILFHDTFYVIGHFHVMFAGAGMFGSFGAFYFYFPAIFGVKYSRIYAYLHYSYYLLGQLMTVIPMFWLGYAGMPRRVLDYPASLGGWHSIISAGHLLSVAGLMAFFIMIFDSLRQGRAVTRNTFGIGRYNTRLNFYLYEASRLANVQQKGWSFFRLLRPSAIKLNNLNYINFEPYETTLLQYTFARK